MSSPRFTLRWAAAVAVVSGLLGVLAFPRFGVWVLAPVSIAGFSVCLDGPRGRAGLGLGYLYGWAFFGPLLAWTGTFVGPIWLLLPFAEAGFFAVLGMMLTSLQARRWRVLWVACAWVLEEALRDRLPFGGFPWGRWAFSQATSPLRWFAALGGAPAVTFVVALSGAALAAGVGALANSERRRAAVALVAAVAVVGSGWVTGLAIAPAAPGRHEVIALVQGSTPDRGLEFNERRRQVLDNHVRETLKLAADVKAGRAPRPTLVVWPENASDIDPFVNADARAQIERAVAAVGVPILVGAVLQAPGEDHVHNVGILWSPTTGPGAQYEKRHPVPFGEYLPLRSIATAISSKANLIAYDMAFRKGNGLITGGPVRLGDVICFEVAYDSLVRSSVRAGAQVIVVQTNNATFGHSAETYQQLAMSRLRAVEFGRSVIQVSTTGKSAMIAPDGSVQAETGGLFTAGYLSRPVGIYSSTTLATRLGWWPEVVASAVAALVWAVALLTVVGERRRRRSIPRDAASPSTSEIEELSPL